MYKMFVDTKLHVSRTSTSNDHHNSSLTIITNGNNIHLSFLLYIRISEAVAYWLSLGFMSHSVQNRSFLRHCYQPISC